jgi:hypothetical protein
MSEPRFEEIACLEIDSASVTVGLEHGEFGPPEPVLRINTGALLLDVRPHHSDLAGLATVLAALRDRFPEPLHPREIEWTAKN